MKSVLVFRCLFVLYLVVLSAGVARGQSLAECLDLARAHAPALLASQAEVERAEYAIREAESALSPTCRLDASFVQNADAPKTVISIPGTGVSQVLDLGSSRTLDLRTGAQYTLYSAGRDRALVRAAQAVGRSRQQTLAQTEADLSLRVSQTYYLAIAAAGLEAAAQEALASARSHLETSAARVRAGVAQRVDSLRAAVDVSQRATALLRAHEAVRLARLDLETAIGVTLDSSRTLSTPGDPEDTPPDTGVLVASALRARPELFGFDAALDENAFRLTASRAARRPQVSLTATAEYSGPNVQSRYFNFSDPGLKTYKLYAGAAAGISLFDGGLVRARTAQLECTRRSLADQRAELAMNIRREVERAAADLQVARAAWPAARERVEASREALRETEAGYKGGTATATELRDAESALADASAEEVTTRMDYWIARAALDHAVGARSGKEN